MPGWTEETRKNVSEMKKQDYRKAEANKPERLLARSPADCGLIALTAGRVAMGHLTFRREEIDVSLADLATLFREAAMTLNAVADVCDEV